MTSEEIDNLAEELRPLLYAVVVRSGIPPGEVDDVVQISLLKIVMHIDNVPHDRILAFARTVARNTVIDYLRRRNHRRFLHEEQTIEEHGDIEDPSAPDQQTLLSRMVINDAISSLSETQQTVVRKRSLGMTYEEIGQALGFSSVAAHDHYKRAIAKLRKVLSVEDQT